MTNSTYKSKSKKLSLLKISTLCGSLLTIILVVNPIGGYIDKHVISPYISDKIYECNNYDIKKLDVIYDYLYQKSMSNEEDKKLWNQSVEKNRCENRSEIPSID